MVFHPELDGVGAMPNCSEMAVDSFDERVPAVT